MRWGTFVFSTTLALMVFLSEDRPRPAPSEPTFRAVIDLTHSASEKFPNWEGAETSPFVARQLTDLAKDGYFSRKISLPEHFATHVDAPAHFAAGRWTVDQIPPERLVAPLIVVDVAGKVSRSADYQVTVEDIVRWERKHGRIPMAAVVAVRTGWALRLPSMKHYRNADSQGTLHFPGFLTETAAFLVERRKIVGLGIDSLSVDYGPSRTFAVHRYTAARNVYHIENLANLDRVPEVGALVVVAPAKLEAGSGGPARILALLRQQ